MSPDIRGGNGATPPRQRWSTPWFGIAADQTWDEDGRQRRFDPGFTLADLRTTPRWCAWRTESVNGRLTKVPYQQVGKQAKSNDPSGGLTYAAASHVADAIVNGSGGGCGIWLGDHDNFWLAGINLDSCRNPENRLIEPWAQAIIDRFSSCTEVSPSETGVKLYVLLKRNDVPELRRLMGTEHGRQFKRGAGEHPPAIELYISNRYFTVTWTALEDNTLTALRTASLENLRWLITDAGPAFAKSASREAPYADDQPAPSAAATRATTVPRADTDWAQEKGKPRGQGEFRRAWDRATADTGVGFDDFFAFMPSHSYIYAPARTLWPGASVNSRLPPVKITDASGQPVLGDNGKEIVLSPAAWLDRYKPVEMMTWAPGLPLIIHNKLILEGGWIDRPSASCFNLYHPPTVSRGDPAKADKWLAHLGYLYPDESDHILNWLAHRVQRPQEKINHALVLGGPQGVGKDTILEPVKYAVGPWNFQEASPTQILGRFNGFLKSVILRVSEARDLGEYDRFNLYDHMKTYTASPPDVLRVDEKHLREYSIINCCGVIITTNHRNDGIFLPADDRRHFVAWTDRTKEDDRFQGTYWTDLWNYYQDGGLRHVTAYLQQRDISAFNPKAPPPKTAAFWSIVDGNSPAEEAELADALDKLGNPPVVTLLKIRNTTSDISFADWLEDRRNRRAIPCRLEKCGYVPVRNPDAESGLWVILGKRQTIYARASLSVREQIASARQLAVHQ